MLVGVRKVKVHQRLVTRQRRVKIIRRPRPSPRASQTYWSVWLAACRSTALIKALSGRDKTLQCLPSNLGHAIRTPISGGHLSSATAPRSSTFPLLCSLSMVSSALSEVSVHVIVSDTGRRDESKIQCRVSRLRITVCDDTMLKSFSRIAPQEIALLYLYQTVTEWMSFKTVL